MVHFIWFSYSPILQMRKWRLRVVKGLLGHTARKGQSWNSDLSASLPGPTHCSHPSSSGPKGPFSPGWPLPPTCHLHTPPPGKLLLPTLPTAGLSVLCLQASSPPNTQPAFWVLCSNCFENRCEESAILPCRSPWCDAWVREDPLEKYSCLEEFHGQKEPGWCLDEPQACV